MSAILSTAAFLRVNSAYAATARRVADIFDQEALRTIGPERFPVLIGLMKQLYETDLKQPLMPVDFTTRNFARQSWGYLWQAVEDLWNARVAKLNTIYYFDAPPAEGRVSIDFDVVDAADAEFQTALSEKIACSIETVSSYIAGRIEGFVRCTSLKMMLDDHLKRSSQLVLPIDGRNFRIVESVMPRSFRPRWDAWMVKVEPVNGGLAEEKDVWIREVMDEDSFYALALMIFAEIDSNPLTGFDVPPHYPFAMDRKPRVPAPSA
jgi:hypothetical protein